MQVQSNVAVCARVGFALRDVAQPKLGDRFVLPGSRS